MLFRSPRDENAQNSASSFEPVEVLISKESAGENKPEMIVSIETKAAPEAKVVGDVDGNVAPAVEKKTRPARPPRKAKTEAKSAGTEALNFEATTASIGTTETKSVEEKPAKSKPAAKSAASKPVASKAIDLSASGLQLVETKGEVVKPTVAATPKPKAPRKTAGWQKKEEAKTEAAPLVMVETQK